jgi:hypothetical protein
MSHLGRAAAVLHDTCEAILPARRQCHTQGPAPCRLHVRRRGWASRLEECRPRFQNLEAKSKPQKHEGALAIGFTGW